MCYLYVYFLWAVGIGTWFQTLDEFCCRSSTFPSRTPSPAFYPFFYFVFWSVRSSLSGVIVPLEVYWFTSSWLCSIRRVLLCPWGRKQSHLSLFWVLRQYAYWLDHSDTFCALMMAHQHHTAQSLDLFYFWDPQVRNQVFFYWMMFD